MRPERLAVPEYRPVPEPRPEPPSGGTVAGVLAVLAFLAVLALVTYRTASIVNVPGTPGPAGRGLQDFRDAIYYPVVAMLDGQNPYEPAAYMARYPVGDTFPLYLPATLLVYLPLGLLPYVTAEWTHFAFTAALTLAIAGLALAIARRRVTVASLFALAAAILASRPGYWNLFLGQCTAVVVVGTYLALHFGRDRPGLGALGVALALLKPTYGVPLALLLLARRDVRPVLLGGAIAAAASIGPALVLVRNAGGLMPFLASIPAGQGGFEASVEVNPVTSTYRLDAVALIGRLAGGTFPGMDAIVFVGVMLIAAVALARLATREADVGARLALPLACLAILTATYHQSYDALLLAAPLVLLVAAPVPGAGAFGRLLLLGLLAIPVGNHLASTRIMSAPHATWLAVVSLNGAAILAAFVAYVALAFRRPEAAPRSTRLLLVVVLVLGAAMRIATIGRPMDHRSLAPWREADYTQIARNFWREGMDVRYPRVDWRGDTPGFAEMEFPAVPWIGGLLFRAFGYHEQLLRLPTALFGILGLLVFARLAAGLLPPPAALFATAAFAVNPLLVYLGSAIQPDPLMLLLSLVAIGLIWRWEDDDRPASLLAASLAVGVAILTKSPAAHLGLVLAWVALRKRGLRALVDPMIVGGAVLALLPPLVWYLWANRFWHLYALSLGLSNETHFTKAAMLFPPRFLYGVLRWETLGIFTPFGWLLALVAFRWREGRVERAAVWYGAVWVFYLASAGTSGDGWSFYYHAVSTAPGCLLMGCGFAALSRGDVLGRRWEPTAGAAIAALTLVSLVAGTALLLRRRDTQPDYLAMRTCALRFVDRVAPGEKVVVDGGAMYDEYGLPVAHNESMVFTWMDRKGFNYGHEELSAGTLDRLAARGARFWMVRHDAVRGDLVDVARTRYRLVDDCDEGYALYDLRPGASRG